MPGSNTKSITKDVMSVDYKRTAILILIFWTVLLSGALVWIFFREQEGARRAAIETGRSQIEMYILFRNLGIGHGSVNAQTPPISQSNPKMRDVEADDVEKPLGQSLTLVDPFNMKPQIYKSDTRSKGLSAHLTSLNPLNPANKADNWEKQALNKFEAGETEVDTLEFIDGVEHLRIMQPLVTEAACMRCHQIQGIKEGELRGGTSVSFPLTPYLAIAREQMIGMVVGFGFLWLLGVSVLGYAVLQLRLRKKERLLAIRALQASQEQYQTLFSKMLDGFAVHELICDPEGCPIDYRFLSVNPSFERLTGLRAQDVLGKTVLEVMPTTEKYWIDSYGQVVLTGEPALIENYSEVLGKHFEVTAFKSAPNQFVTIFVDVSEQKRISLERQNLEKQLTQSQKLETIGTMVGGVSHELNNVLQSMFLYGGLIQDELPPGSELHKNMQQLLEDGGRARDLVNQILTFSRKSDMHYEIQPIHSIVVNALNSVRGSLAPHIILETSIDVQVGPILCESTQIHQIVINLCANAEEAIGEQSGQISVNLREVTAKIDKDSPELTVLELKVNDTGHGMSAETLERIYDPFFTTKGIGEGTGLGLSVVYGIVRTMKGRISVSSEEGKGSGFQIYLPLAGSVLTSSNKNPKTS